MYGILLEMVKDGKVDENFRAIQFPTMHFSKKKKCGLEQSTLLYKSSANNFEMCKIPKNSKNTCALNTPKTILS